MIIMKSRKKPEYLTILEILDKRMKLPDLEKQQLLKSIKGYEGELYFDSLIENYVEADALVLNDLVLTQGGTIFQIDALIFTSDSIYLYEVKNYEGNFYCSPGQFRTSSGQEILNPSAQLNRTTTLFSKLMRQWNNDLPIQSSVVFVNSAFTLYEAKGKDPFVFPTQMKAHFSMVNRRAGPLSKRHRYLAQKLIEETQKEVPFQRQFPFFDFEGLKKGMSCIQCGSFELENTLKKSHCQSCGNKTTMNDLFLSQVNEFQILFPEEQVTRNSMYEWCGGQLSERRIWSLLQSNFTMHSQGKAAYYQKK